MKKLSLLSAAFALVMGLSQCKKPNLPVLNIGETQHVVLNASWDNGGSKIDQNGVGLKWNVDDKLVVMQNEVSVGTLTCTDADNGTFEGPISATEGTLTFTFKSEKYQNDFKNQTGALNDVVYLTSGDVPYSVFGNYNVSMTMPHAVIKLDLSAFAASTKTGNIVTISIGGSDKVSVTNITSDSKAVYVAIPVDETPTGKLYTFNGNGKFASVTWKLEGNKFYTKKGVGETPTGESIAIVPAVVVTGDFTVGMDGDTPITVEFAPGNLYYNGADDSHKLYESLPSGWNFYTHQYDGVAKAAAMMFPPTCPGEICLFTWGYGDWSMIWNTEEYEEGNTMTDWGTITTLPDNAAGTTWHTLSSDEWKYLLDTRTVNGDHGEGYSYQRATINGVGTSGGDVCGMLIYPDSYTKQTTATSYSKEEWAVMEADGVIFLPSAGDRTAGWITGITQIATQAMGMYWSKTPLNDNSAYELTFISSEVRPQATDTRSYGRAVRLVKYNN